MREIHKNRISKAGEFSVACEALGPELHSFAVNFLENVWPFFISYFLTYFSLESIGVLSVSQNEPEVNEVSRPRLSLTIRTASQIFKIH